eukprot:2069862-Pleurochrysis_carterae.AAC.1
MQAVPAVCTAAGSSWSWFQRSYTSYTVDSRIISAVVGTRNVVGCHKAAGGVLHASREVYSTSTPADSKRETENAFIDFDDFKNSHSSSGTKAMDVHMQEAEPIPEASEKAAEKAARMLTDDSRGTFVLEEDAARRGSELVKRYFLQLTKGCGRKRCPNVNCLSCIDGRGLLEPTEAALLSLELAKSDNGDVGLCDELPPFLHLELIQGYEQQARSSGDVKPLTREVAAVFSSSDALNRSFLSTKAQLQVGSAALRDWLASVCMFDTLLIRSTAREAKHKHVPEVELIGLDTYAIIESYQSLLRLQSAELILALMNATESLLVKLQVHRLNATLRLL